MHCSELATEKQCCALHPFLSFIYEPLQYFQRVGLPGPKPHFLLGNIPLVRQFKVCGDDQFIHFTHSTCTSYDQH